MKYGTLDGLKSHLCSLIMLLPGMPKNLLCKEELLPSLTIHGWLPELQASLSLIVRKIFQITMWEDLRMCRRSATACITQ